MRVCSECGKKVLACPDDRCRKCGGELVAAGSVPPLPGDALHRDVKRILRQFGISLPRRCQCRSWIRKMNHWGVEGCEANEGLIVDHLVGEMKKMGGLSLVPGKAAICRRVLARALNKARGL